MIIHDEIFGTLEVFGILFDCPWNDEAGVVVKFENGKINVGKDDLIL